MSNCERSWKMLVDDLRVLPMGDMVIHGAPSDDPIFDDMDEMPLIMDTHRAIAVSPSRPSGDFRLKTGI